MIVILLIELCRFLVVNEKLLISASLSLNMLRKY